MARLQTKPAPAIKPENLPELNTYFDDLWLAFINWISNAIQTTLNYFVQLFNKLELALSSILNSIAAALDTAMSELVATIRSWTTTVTNLVNTLITSIQSAISNLFSALYDATVTVIDKTATFINNVAVKVQTFLQDVTNKVLSFVDAAIAKVKEFATAALELLGTALNKLIDKIISPIAQILTKAENAVQANEAAITQAWVDLVSGSEALLQATVGKLADLAATFREAINGLQKTITDVEGRISKDVGDKVTQLINLIFGTEGTELPAAVLNTAERFLSGEMRMEEFRTLLRGIMETATPQSALGRLLLGGLLFIVLMLPAGWNLGAAYSNVLLRELALVVPFNVLSPPDAIAAYRRVGLGREEAVETIRAGGWDARDANLMIDNSNIVPSPDLVAAAWLRGAIDDGVMEDAFHQMGFTAGWRGVLTEMAFLIPPVQDLITMAVREAFSPEIAEAFGQFQDFPEEFAEWARKQGLSREWAQRYWAAHWGLPSPMQGFEMLHRGLITPDELNKLLRALDVMPFWREKLTQIAYNPFTRVDIRRMHQLGVLDEAAVLRAHKDLGYDDEKAALLTSFVLKLNKPKPTQDDEELGKLSRAAVLGFFKDGLLNRQRAAELLVLGGHTPEAAQLYLEAVEMDEERAIRAQEIALVIEQFKAGALTYEEAIDSLNGLGLATLEVGKAINQLQRALKSQNKLPSLTDGRQFYFNNIINRDAFRDLLKRLGYTPQWVDAYVQLADMEKEDASKSG